MIKVKELTTQEQCKYNFLSTDYDIIEQSKNFTGFTAEHIKQLALKYNILEGIVASHLTMFIYPKYLLFKYKIGR